MKTNKTITSFDEILDINVVFCAFLKMLEYLLDQR